MDSGSAINRFLGLPFRTLRGRILLWFVVIVAALVIAAATGFVRLTGYIAGQARSEMEGRITQIISSMESTNTLYSNLVASAMKVFSLLVSQQGPASIRGKTPEGVPMLFLGSKAVNGEKTLVDELSKLMGGTATILVRDGDELVRVSTSIRNTAGKRAKGTLFDGSADVKNDIFHGKSYTGIIDILGRPHYACYTPIKDSKGMVIGALYVGYDMQALDPLREAIEPRSVLEKGFLALLDSKGRMILRTKEDKHHPFDEESIAKSALSGKFTDSDWALSVRPFDRWKYSVVGGLHLPDVSDLAWTFGFQVLVVMAAVMLTVLVTSYWLTSRLTHALELVRETNVRLESTRKRLAGELDEAVKYVRSILPAPTAKPYVIDWCFEPSTELGGDAFGYHAIDGEHFAIYLLDVCGHGVGAALLSATAINLIRTGAFHGIDFRDPGAVLTELNKDFPMERHNGMYFTIWYGVYHAPTRTLRHACGGHPPALLLSPEGEIGEIRQPGPIVGFMPEALYTSGSIVVPPGSRLLLFSDGAYEVTKPDKSLLDFEEFKAFMAANGCAPDAFERLQKWLHSFQGPGPLEDDLTMVRVLFS
jgi:sigma-B regulation protein RsbU (phosphoserine phosphatase)